MKINPELAKLLTPREYSIIMHIHGINYPLTDIETVAEKWGLTIPRFKRVKARAERKIKYKEVPIWIDDSEYNNKNLISKEQFLEALGVVQEYTNQCLKIAKKAIDNEKTPINTFLSSADISVRLKNVLFKIENDNKNPKHFIEDITPNQLKQTRNAGKKTIIEFEKARREFLKKNL